MADEKKGITVKVDAELHAQVKEYIESHGMTMAEFISAACDELMHPKMTNKENKKMENMRTVAFQVPESLFQRIKEYLQRNHMSQKDFLLGLIETELEREQTEREAVVAAVSADEEPEGELPVADSEAAVSDEFAPENESAAETEAVPDIGSADEGDPEEGPEEDAPEDEEESSGMGMMM